MPSLRPTSLLGRGRRELKGLALGLEAHLVVGAVAKRLVRGVATAAERHDRAPGQLEDVAVLVRDHDVVALETVGSVVPDDDLRVRHEARRGLAPAPPPPPRGAGTPGARPGAPGGSPGRRRARGR